MGSRALATDDIVAYKEEPGLRSPMYAGQVLEVHPHVVDIQPLRRGQAVGDPIRLKNTLVQLLDDDQAAQVRRGVFIVQVLKRRPRSSSASRAAPTPAVAADPGAGPAGAVLPQLAPVVVRVGPVQLRAQPKPLPPVRSAAYLAYVRRLPCCSCGAPPGSDPHHDGPRGVGQRTDDLRTVPLCRQCHDCYHDTGCLPRRDRAETVVHTLRVQVQLLVAFYGRGERAQRAGGMR